ncbi:MAG TPA: LexA family transcriptional regulator [Chitinophagaceae bacterium]|jgi:phage repressor protein C with HTH and peptisase S24 domain|nr:LexA family transcriptional regulator [Chitinophagaceae bacterium]
MITPETLLEIRSLYGLSQSDFARKLRISRELLNKMEKGRFPVSKRTAERIKTFGEQHSKSDFSQEVNFLGKASQAGDRPFGTYHEQRLVTKNAPTHLSVPLVAIKAQAGYIKAFEQVDYIDTLDQYSLPPGVNPAGAVWRYFEIDGDSMEPTLHAGDLVLATMVPAEDWNDIRNLSVYIIHTADQLLIKRVYRKSAEEWVLVSDNDTYSQVTLRVEHVKEIWIFRRHIRAVLPAPKEFPISC